MDHEHTNMSRPALSLSEAAQACGVSRSTIRRYREAERFPDAFQAGDDQAWHIPVDNLIAAGLRLTERGGPGPQAPPSGPVNQEHGHPYEQGMSQGEPTLSVPLTELVELRVRAERAEAHAQSLERLLDERGAVVAALQTAMRAIEGSPSRSTDVVEAADVVDVRTAPESTVEGKPRWWRKTSDVR